MPKERGHGEGTARQRPDGKWEAREPRDAVPRGEKPRSFYGPSKSAALKKMREALKERERGVSPEASRRTVAEHIEHWLETSVKGVVWRTTYEDYERHARLHIVPELGDLKLRDLTRDDVRALYRKKEREGYSARTIGYIDTTLRKALQEAVDDEIILRNVAKAVKPPTPERKAIQTLTAEEVRRFFAAAIERGDRFYPLYVLAVATGARPGELFALAWEDVADDFSRVHIHRALSLTKEGPEIRERTKTGPGRHVTLIPDAARVLREHRKSQAADRLALKGLWADHGLVFPAANGAPMRRQNLQRRHYKPTLKAAGLPDIPYKNLRHSASTMIYELGVDPKILQGIMGHANISMTLDTYTHPSDALQQDAMRRYGEHLFPGEDTPGGTSGGTGR